MRYRLAKVNNAQKEASLCFVKWIVLSIIRQTIEDIKYAKRAIIG